MSPPPLRITIVTYNWPPRNAIGTHRPYSWAKYWSRAGHRVRVVTAKKYTYDAPLDLNLPALDDVDVIETDYVSGLGRLANAVLSSPFRSIATKLYRRTRGVGTAPNNPREAWPSALSPLIQGLADDADVVVSTFGPRSCHLIGAEFKKANPDLLWVADYRDLWSLNHIESWTDERRAEHRANELASVGRHADLLTTVSDELSEKLQSLHHGKPTLTVANGFDSDLAALEARIQQRRHRMRSGPLRIVYTGKIYPGLRDPAPLMEAVLEGEQNGSLQRASVELHIYGGQVDGMEALLSSGRYAHFVQLHGHVPREVALKAQAEADLLLLLESPLPEAKGMLTGKLFEYMFSGVPILSLGSPPDSAIARVIDETKTGICAQADKSRISKLLMRLQRGDQITGFAPDVTRIMSYSRENLAILMLENIANFRSKNLQQNNI